MNLQLSYQSDIDLKEAEALGKSDIETTFISISKLTDKCTQLILKTRFAARHRAKNISSLEI
ncbi:hypothetical protein LBWT_5410 [Leptolyngbya boryana IAM M-101]|nr:hypothetical protein LBWT_5410 [Leptolyngbya boryana IAM M-101]BAS60992.1 hypothetical protein LBDG_05410 [Leptolyngbya boryana dg5]